MQLAFKEVSYPSTFRKKDAEILGKHLKLRHSVEIVGMKRVGISNFLRFFLYHPKIVKTYISKTEKHLFIPVDLNDLVERELMPFWVLTLKRLSDAVESSDCDRATKSKVSSLFLQSIQLQDNFLTIENIKKAILTVIEQGYIPTIFLLRFDRMKEAASHEFFSNLQGLVTASNSLLSFVFTSVRPLDQIRSDVFTREELMTFSHLMYIEPARKQDTQIALSSIWDTYRTKQPNEILNAVLALSGGHMQYVYLANVILNEKTTNGNTKPYTTDEIKELLLSDERVKLQSEEIYESLTKAEQEVIKSAVGQTKPECTTETKYLCDTGIIQKSGIFSQIFEQFVLKHTKKRRDDIDFSKKEHQLYSLLLENLDSICERDTIIHAVWPESEEIGVSDWTIDRLVARLRQKLALQKSEYKIVTVKTRGYKLVQS
ncbi:MAG TPA: helix-turn-helix domain-containing protein [Candidatus Levybacteria bacterium]|nr:helix-turn-helix domain-containing protein [Candidatus Levybacteria bacterium]